MKEYTFGISIYNGFNFDVDEDIDEEFYNLLETAKKLGVSKLREVLSIIESMEKM